MALTYISFSDSVRGLRMVKGRKGEKEKKKKERRVKENEKVDA